MRIINKQSQAFTLLELMVVIVLVSIIAGFAIPTYTKSVKKARIRDAVVQLQGAHAAASIYYAQALQVWDAGGPAGTSENDIDVINANLETNLISNAMTFTYLHVSQTDFSISAFWDDTSPSNEDFTITITQNPIENNNPCCSPDGACTFGTNVLVPNC